MFETLAPVVLTELTELGQKYEDLQTRIDDLAAQSEAMEDEQADLRDHISGILDNLDVDEDGFFELVTVLRHIGEEQFDTVSGTNEFVTAALEGLNPIYDVTARLNSLYSEVTVDQITLSWALGENEDGTKGIVFEIDYPVHPIPLLISTVGWFRRNNLPRLANAIIEAQRSKLDEELTDVAARAAAIRQL